MIWKSKCQRIQTLLALWVGRDLDERGEQEAKRHIAECPHCRAHWQKLQAGQHALEQAKSTPAFVNERAEPSLWGRVHAEISARKELSERQTAYGWLPVGALAAACLALMVLAQNSPPFDQPRNDDTMPRMMQVADFPDWPGASPDRFVPPRSIQPHWVSDDGRPQPPSHRLQIPVDYSDPRGF